MCKEKWNCFDHDYKRITNYPKGTSHNTSYLEMNVE